MTSLSDARAKEFSSAFGWPAAIDTAGVVTVRDSVGRVRATYQGVASKYPTAHLPEGGTHTIRLPEGDVFLTNGRPNATQRHAHNGHVDLNGRRYEFRHTRRWNTEVRCDGTRVALLRRRLARTKVRVDATRDETDLLATVLCWHAVQAGRRGAIAAAFGGL